MVNKQYTIQNGKKSRNITPSNKYEISNPILNSTTIISSAEVSSSPAASPPQAAKAVINRNNSLNTISANIVNTNQDNNRVIMMNDGLSTKSVYGQNITTYLHHNDELNICDEICERINHKDLSIKDIGRFQYILQLDEEMATSPSASSYRIPLSTSLSSNDNLPNNSSTSNESSNTNSLNSTNFMNSNYWKASSQSPITATRRNHHHHNQHHHNHHHHNHHRLHHHLHHNQQQRHQQIYKYLKQFWIHSKWPLALIFAILIFGAAIYFLTIKNNPIIQSTNSKLQYSQSSATTTNLDQLDNDVNKFNNNDLLNNRIAFILNSTVKSLPTAGVSSSDAINDDDDDTFFKFDVVAEIQSNDQDQDSRRDGNGNTHDDGLTILIKSPENSSKEILFKKNINKEAQNILPLPSHEGFDEYHSSILPYLISSTSSTSSSSVTRTTSSVSTSTVPSKQTSKFRNTQILEISTQKLPTKQQQQLDEKSQEQTILPEHPSDSSLMFPTKETLEIFGFTSGHQNNFGVPIEEDERILRLLNDQLMKAEQERGEGTLKINDLIQSTTDANVYRTRVSPTLPIIQKYDATTERFINNSSDDEICESTSLSMCRSVLYYDLTAAKHRKNVSPLDLEHFQYLIASKCSLRAHEFICSVLEPECRPKRMGILQPCKRICKSILEPCAHIISASEFLTLAFDCDSYPDSDNPNICRDATKNSKCFDNEFQCNDMTCIPHQWKCDNIKDCSSAEDEENCKFCEQDEFRCHGTDKCIPDKWRCDQYDDCSDSSDEVDCYEDENRTFPPAYGTIRIFPFSQEQNPKYPTRKPYLTITDEDRVNTAVDEKERKHLIHTTTTFNSINDKNNAGGEIYSTGAEKIEIYKKKSKNGDSTNISSASESILIVSSPQDGTRKNNSPSDEIQSAASGITIPSFSKSLANFQDSKEIMMTSDSESDYKYSRINDNDNKEVTLSSASSVISAHVSPCPEGELRCISGTCITLSQLCDKITDCTDGADEAMCVYKN